MPRRAHGIVSLLDPSTSERVVGVWRGLEHRFGVRGIFVMPYPHFTYQVAAEYDRDSVEGALEQFARATRPFDVETAGVASFGPPWPVVYIALAEDPSLRILQQEVWAVCSPHARGVADLYHPARWTPHISLAYGDEATSTPLPEPTVQEILRLLARGGYRWKLRIDNVALVMDDGRLQKPVRTFPLRGS
jgi:2'-5' RNA ligase